MYSRSSSDYITRKKNQQLKNVFVSKESGNYIQKLKINALLSACNTDDEGVLIPATWSNVPMMNDCSNATIVDETHTTPLMTTIPEMTIEPTIKNRYIPNFCGSSFPPENIPFSWK